MRVELHENLLQFVVSGSRVLNCIIGGVLIWYCILWLLMEEACGNHSLTKSKLCIDCQFFWERNVSNGYQIDLSPQLLWIRREAILL